MGGFDAPSLKTDKLTWKKCSHCHENFPETNDFWVKNGKNRDGSQRYRTQCGDKRNGQKLGQKQMGNDLGLFTFFVIFDLPTNPNQI